MNSPIEPEWLNKNRFNGLKPLPVSNSPSSELGSYAASFYKKPRIDMYPKEFDYYGREK